MYTRKRATKVKKSPVELIYLELITTFIIFLSALLTHNSDFFIPLTETLVAACLALFTAGDARLRGPCRLPTARSSNGAGVDHQRIRTRHTANIQVSQNEKSLCKQRIQLQAIANKVAKLKTNNSTHCIHTLFSRNQSFSPLAEWCSLRQSQFKRQ